MNIGDVIKTERSVHKSDKYTIYLTETFIYDPKSAQGGHRLLNEYLAKLYMESVLNKKNSQRT